MADDELFEDLGDFNDLDDTPDFDMGGEELPFADTGDEGGGISRTFKIVFGLMTIAVVGIVVLLLFFALSSGDKLTANEKTSTAVVKTNIAMQDFYNATVTALVIMDMATQTAVRNSEMTATQDEFNRQTQVAIDATNAAGTAAAQAIIQQTLDAQQTATQESLNATATAQFEANKLVGQVIDEQGTAFEGVTLHLYRDDGDGEFNPAVDLAAPTPAPAGGGAVTGGQSIAYGATAQGTLVALGSAQWTFTGTASDVVTIDAIASDPVQMDMFVELLGPDGSVLTGDDDSGDASNARIANYTLAQSGAFTIRVSSVSGPGDYTLTLVKETGSTTRHNSGIVLVSAHYGPQPGALAQEGTTTPVPLTGDELVDTIITATGGAFDFGSLEPGIYWIELDYNSLPESLKALVPAGQNLVIKATVPVGGNVTFEVGAPTPVPTVPTGPATLNAIEQTASARPPATAGSPQPTTSGVPQLVTLTNTAEPPVGLPTTGFFSDIGDSAGGIDGSSGLTVLAIAAVGLVAVVFIARKLRTSA
jgi:hypothetical protein